MFTDIIGLKEEVEELKLFLEAFRKDSDTDERKVPIPKGVLMHGTPGTGKTLMARAVSNETDTQFFVLDTSDYDFYDEEQHIRKIRSVLNEAVKKAPSIVFIDELDKFIGADGFGSTDNQTVSLLLNYMDGFYQNEDVMILAATNAYQYIPKPLLRSGRFDRKMRLSSPNLNDRMIAIKRFGDPYLDFQGITYEKLATLCGGMTIADIKSVIHTLRLDHKSETPSVIDEEDFINAIEKQQMGLLKDDPMVSKEDLKRIAYHEAGHAIVNHFRAKKDAYIRLSIASRVDSQGHLAVVDDQTGYKLKSDLEKSIETVLGGYAAEKIFLGETSTGSSDDLKHGFMIARAMVEQFAMGNNLPPRIYQNRDHFDMIHYSPKTRHKLDKKTNKILNQALKNVIRTIKKHDEKVKRIVEALIEKHHLTKDEFLELVDA